MPWISNKQIKELREAIDVRMHHIDDSLKMLHNEVRRVHVLQTCGAESAQFREIIHRLSIIEEQLSTFYFVKVNKKEKEAPEASTNS
jgi:coenzyme F420-reducing hydrogenase delta subunit